MYLLLISVIVLTSFVTFLLQSIGIFKINKRTNDKYLHGPKGYPLIGLGLEFIGLDSVDTFNKLIKYCTDFDYLARAYAGWHRFILVAVPEDLEKIMTDQRFLEKSDEYNMLRDWLQDGLLTVGNKDKWQKRRKVLTPAFHFSILEDFIGVMDQQAGILTKILQKQVNGKAFDICKYITLYTMDVICETSMGTKFNAQTNADQDYVRSVVELSSLIHWRHHHFLARDNWFWNLTSSKKRHDQLINIIHTHTNKIILARREEKLKLNDSNDSNDNKISFEETGIKKRQALLDVLLESTIDGERLSNKDIQEETDNFMFAGHDTTTSAINFLLYNLANNPTVQEKVYEEIVNILGDDPLDPLTLHKLNSFKYLELVIKESLRLYTPVPLIGRYLREDIEINGHVYPANHNIILAIYMLHRNPKLYPDPEKFIPERFAEIESHSNKNAYSYIPFSAGYRNCIGQRFAQLELKSVVSRILQNYVIELGEPNFKPVLTAEIILKPQNGIHLKLKPRKST